MLELILASPLRAGGAIMLAIAGLSLVMWALIVDRYWFLYQDLQRLREALAQRWRQEAGIDVAADRRLRRGLTADFRQHVSRHVPMIQMITAILPLLGLLGTVTGMIKTFDAMTVFGEAQPIDVFNPVYADTSLRYAFLGIDSDTEVTQTGLYVQDQIKLDDRWVITLGGRYDRAESETMNRLANQTIDQSDSEFTFRAGVVYLAESGWAPYVSYSESFFPTATIDPLSGKPFDPETGHQFEIGVRYQPPGRTGTYSAAVFDLQRQNYVTYDNQTFLPKQTGEVQVRGLELEAVLEPITNLNVTAAYSWIPKAEVTESADPTEIGTRFSSVPKHQIALWTDYRFAGGFKAGLGVRYVGSVEPGLGTPAGTGDLPDYTLVNAMIGYQTGNWDLALNVQNLADKEYLTSCGGGNCYFGEQREVAATAIYRW
jgi:iron complex outermembrane receptor protein